MSRLRSRLAVLPRALAQRALYKRRPPEKLERILIAHHLLLGDTILLTPLLAKLRSNHSQAQVVMTAPRAVAALYEGRPYGVRVVAIDPHDAGSLAQLFAWHTFDLAIVPGENRYAWLALAAGARWIRAHAGESQAYKNWPVDELRPYPTMPAAWGDIIAELVSGPAPAPFNPVDWPAPSCKPFVLPSSPRYAVLHVGASTPLKCWEPPKWRALAARLSSAGIQAVFLAGPGEDAILDAVALGRDDVRYPGNLELSQVWHLLRAAQILIAPDTGIAHLGRAAGVPTVALYGPGSALISGPGEFWRESPFRAVTMRDFPCRDQRFIFYRPIDWARTCTRSVAECAAPRCMQSISVDEVWRNACELLGAAIAA